jgi:signal transduction histidine kinase/CheY-like chemotaxis protein
MKSLIKIFILIALAFNITFVFSQDKTVFTPTSSEKQVLGGPFDYFEDPAGDMSFDTVHRSHNLDFKPFLNNNIGFGYDKVLWIRYSIDFTSYHEPYFFVTENFPHLGELSLFYPTSIGEYKSLNLSANTPVSKRPFSIHNNLFKVPKSANTAIGTYYMRYAPKGNYLLVDLTFSGQKGLVESIDREMLANGLFFGGLIAMWLYNSLLYYKLRTRDYLYYLYYLGSLIGLFAYLNGFAPLLISDPKIQEPVFALFSFASVHGTILFAREFLSLKKFTPRLDKAIWIFQWVVFGIMLAVLFMPLTYILPTLHLMAAFSVPVVGAAIIRLQQGFLPAKYYLAGWAGFSVALVIYLLGSINILPINFFTTYLFHTACFLEALLFAFGVAYRLKLVEESAAKEKNAFLAMVSHELKTPLQNIVSSIDLLSLKIPNSERILGRLRNATSNLELQVKDLTDFSRLGSGSLTLNKDEVNISSLACETISDLKNLAEIKGLQIITNIDPNIIGIIDPYRFQQIVQNLLGNAIKYTNVGYVEVTLKIDEARKRIILTVKDSGIGFEEKASNNLFKPFTQINKRSTRDYNGMGMGLAIVKNLVNIFGGGIDVHSSQGHGSTFTVTIPVEISTNSKLEDDQHIFCDKNKNSILLVDDSEVVRDDLSDILGSLGYECDMASGGGEAISMAGKKKYCAILLDINMPDIDGFEVAKKIRNTPTPNSDVPLIWISANAPMNSSKLERQYFTHFLVKPIHAVKLIDTLKKIIPHLKTLPK